MPTPKQPLTLLTAAAGLLIMAAPSAQACSSEPYIGSVCATAADFCPLGYKPAAGQVLQVSEYNALFALLGPNYGGNGHTTFALPDLRGRSMVGTGQRPGGQSVELAQQRGEEEVTLTEAQMPSHTHGVYYDSGTFSGKIVATTSEGGHKTPTSDRRLGKLSGGRNDNLYSESDDNLVELQGVAIQQEGAHVDIRPAGHNYPFSNLPPQLGMTYCIAVQGIFPQHN